MNIKPKSECVIIYQHSHLELYFSSEDMKHYIRTELAPFGQYLDLVSETYSSFWPSRVYNLDDICQELAKMDGVIVEWLNNKQDKVGTD